MNARKVLLHNVLVLNRSWIPIHITTVRDAIGLVFVGAANVIVPDEMKSISGKTVAYEFEAMDYSIWTSKSCELDKNQYEILSSAKNIHFKPSVVALTRYNGIPRYEIRFCRASLYERDSGKCQYCGKRISRGDATIDHVQPRSKGGKNSWSNAVLACKSCNSVKSDFTLDQSGMKLLSKPKKPNWISVRFGKTRSVKERAEWRKFTEYVESEVS